MNLSDRAVGGSLGRGQVSIQRSQMSALTVTELLLRTSNIQHYPGDQGHQGHLGHPTHNCPASRYFMNFALQSFMSDIGNFINLQI